MSVCVKPFVLLVLVAFANPAVSTENGERGITGTGAGAAGDRKYAVVIGVNRYADSGVGQLECAVSDAEAIHRVLTSAPGGFTPECTVLLTDNQPEERQPTRPNVLKFLNTFVGLAKPSDTVLVYFAGHGTTEEDRLYLLPSDTALSMLGDTAIPFERIKALVETSPAQRKVLILDACHSGAGRALNRMTAGVGKQFDEASRGMVVLASCGPDEVSREMPDTGHGAFTYFLLEGLRGAADANKDGFIGVKELSNHTWDRTRFWAAGNGWQQNPWEHSHVSGDIILAQPHVSSLKEQPPVTLPKTIPQLIKSGKWTGIWQKTNDSFAEYVLYLSSKDGFIKGVGQVKGWTCWEVFEGKQHEDRLVLKGTKVIRNSRPKEQYELDLLELFVTNSGSKLDGKWSDDSGSSGRVELTFATSVIANEHDIQQSLAF